MEQKNTTQITKMSYGAFGLAEDQQGKKLFIENSCPGDLIEYKIYDDRQNFAYAQITSIKNESKLRAKDPKCKIHKICGSCQWQHIEYQEQLKFKKQNLLECLEKEKIIFETSLVPELIGMPKSNPWHYRNKVIYPVATVKSTGRLLAGYFKRNTNELINIKYCPIQYSIFDEIIEKFKEIASEKHISKKFLRHILVRANSDFDQVLLSLIIRKKELSNKNKDSVIEALNELCQTYPQIKTSTINFNDDSTNVILGNETLIINGPGYIEENFCGLKLKISTESFFQVNTNIFREIIYFINNHIENNSKILDAYCGIGTISLSLAKLKQNLSITGIESVEAAIINANDNAQENNIDAKFICAKLEDQVERLTHEDFDYLIINPPRKGCTKKVIDNIQKINSKKIIYVSCNPATLVRDIKLLESYGFNLEKIQSFDMFPHSFHFETVAILTRQLS